MNDTQNHRTSIRGAHTPSLHAPALTPVAWRASVSTVIITTVLGGSACFPAAKPEYDIDEVQPPTQEELPTNSPVEPSFVPSTESADLVGSCPASVTGLAAQFTGISAPTASFGVGLGDIQGVPDEQFLQDGFALSVALVARAQPMAIGCIEDRTVGGFRDALQGSMAVSRMIRHAARTLGEPSWRSNAAARTSFEEARSAICARFPDSISACGSEQGALPDDLRAALGPLLWAIHDGIAIRQERDARLVAPRTADWWQANGGHSLVASVDDTAVFNAGVSSDRQYLSEDRGKLYGAAAHISEEIEKVDWVSFEGRMGIQYDYQTPAGWIRVRGGGEDQYRPSMDPILLLIDLGGSDQYLNEVASNTSGDNAVSVAIDLSGNDIYTYEEALNVDPTTVVRLPLDADGAVSRSGQIVAGSASERARQGAARNGIAMLFDLGRGNDSYVALRTSQGYAHQGVGVLFDDGGADTYLAEAASQGAGQFGIGLLIDLGLEDDIRKSSHASQGFGYVAGVGVVFDAGGNDEYECHPDHDGQPAYTAPQLPGVANSSVCQGAGLGFRIRDVDFTLAGGFGLLVDLEGDDQYRAGVYAQGAGYWQGFGLLSDLGGADVYDGLYYTQGAAAHFGVGMLADGGPGDDRVGFNLGAETFTVASAQDFSVAVFVNEEGNDTYRFPPVGGSAASCGSVTLFIDNAGEDTYMSRVSSAAGVASVQACGNNTNLTSSAVFLDVGGQDTWGLSSGSQDNNTTWAVPMSPSNGADAYAQDVASGDSGIHVGLP